MQDREISFERSMYQGDPTSSGHLEVFLEDVIGVPGVDPSLMHPADQFLAMALELA